MVVAAHSELFEVTSESPCDKQVIVQGVTLPSPYDSWYSFQQNPCDPELRGIKTDGLIF